MGLLKQDFLSSQAKRFKEEKTVMGGIKGRPGNQFKTGMEPGMYEMTGEFMGRVRKGNNKPC